MTPKTNSSIALVLVSLFAAATIAGLLSYILLTHKNGGQKTAEAESYSAVFLTSGQVYFGKMSREKSEVVLTSVYYVSSAAAGTDKPTDEKGLSLIHLGGEVYGPTDEMRINPEQILFTETLRSDSEVAKAIAGNTSTPSLQN
jgi:hypothetical protein